LIQRREGKGNAWKGEDERPLKDHGVGLRLGRTNRARFIGTVRVCRRLMMMLGRFTDHSNISDDLAVLTKQFGMSHSYFVVRFSMHMSERDDELHRKC
jgi:hypothetical protein